MLKLRVKQLIYESNIWHPKKAKASRYSAKDLKNLRILPENPVEGLRSRREHCWSYVVSTFENATKSLLVQGSVQLEHSSHIVKVYMLHANTSIPGIYWRERPKRQAHLELWHPGKGGKPVRVIQLNCGEVRTHVSYKTIRTWQNFNNWGTKMILL